MEGSNQMLELMPGTNTRVYFSRVWVTNERFYNIKEVLMKGKAKYS